MAIFSVVIGSITSVALTVTTQRVKNLVVSEVDVQGNSIMTQMTQAVRNATAVSLPGAGASSTSLSLSTPTTSLNPTIYDSVANGSVTSLRVREGTSGTANLLTNNLVTVTNLSFSNVAVTGANDSVKISFTLSYYNPSSLQPFKYQKTFYGAASRR